MNKKKENQNRKTISRRDFVVSTTVAGIGLTVFGCKKAKSPEPAPPTTNSLKITNAIIPSNLSFTTSSDFSFQGGGYALGDKLIFTALTDATINFTIELKAVTANNCTFTIPAGVKPNTYRISIVRGTQSLLLGSSTIDTPFANIPDKAGMTVKGTVFAAGVGIANVIVSDGVEVTKTDENGVYYLPSNKTKNFVFISIPSGYEVESKNNILPAFYKNFSANAQTVEYADFELKAVDNNKHIMLALGDMHLANRNNDITQFQNGFLNDAKATIAKYKSEGYKVYGLTLGDMSWDAYWYDKNFGLTDYVNTMRPIDIPIFHTMGNHDNNPYIADDWNAETAFRGNLGPTYYSFNIGKIHYIVLDDIEYLNTGGTQGTQGQRNYNGVIVPDQLAWLQKDLNTITDKNTTIVVSMHINLHNNPTLSGQTETSTLRLTGASSFINMFSSFNDVHVITGHTHYSFNYAQNAKLMEHNTTAVCATWWWTGRNGYAGNQISKDGTPGGYEIWKFNGTTYQWRYKSIGYDENYQFRAYDLNKVHITAAKYAPAANNTYAPKLPDFASPYHVENNNNEILVNVWNYDKNWTVEIFENSTPLTVTRVRTKDPLHIISYEALRLNVNADPTEDFVSNLTAHMFKAKANSATTPITIKVTDRFGNIYTETMTRPKDLTTSMK